MVKPNKPYFLVRISKQEQSERREKQGSLALVLDDEDMSRNLQSGEIIAIGSKAAEIFPEAKVGHTLIMHHFVEGNKESRNDSLVFEDADFRYYVVSSYAQTGKATESFGVWDGEKIIPNKEFVFLKKNEAAIPKSDQIGFLNQAMEHKHIEGSANGIFVFKEYHATTKSNTEKLATLKEEAMHLGKMKQTHEVRTAIEDKEREMLMITKSMNAATFKPFYVKYAPKVLNEWFDREIKEDDVLFCQNTAAEMEVEFKNTTYIVCKTQYIGFMLN